MIANPYAYTESDLHIISDSRIAIKQGFDEGVMATLDYLIAHHEWCDRLPVVAVKTLRNLKEANND